MANNPKTVITCYDLLDAMFVDGLGDLTDGIYHGDPNYPFMQAQADQAEYLLDQINCSAGSKILDVGCGNGRILAAAKARGAEAIGITISKQQVKRNKGQDLDARLINYRDIPQDWNGMFDGIIANGSIEHFVQAEEVADGKQDALYEEMFAIFARILKPSGKVATTVIHQNSKEPIDANDVLKGSKSYKKSSDLYHYAQLEEDFGGYYPRTDQLIKAAKRSGLKHSNRVDGTEDYRLTSEYWLQKAKKDLVLSPKMWFTILGKLLKHPIATISMLDNLLVQQTWMWQFRPGANGRTPTRLYRDTWSKKVTVIPSNKTRTYPEFIVW